VGNVDYAKERTLEEIDGTVLELPTHYLSCDVIPEHCVSSK
jgi:hypothetical protein